MEPKKAKFAKPLVFGSFLTNIEILEKKQGFLEQKRGNSAKCLGASNARCS